MRDFVVITGSSGLIGSALVERLRSKYRIVGLDRQKPKHEDNSYCFISADFASTESVTQAIAAIARLKPDRIVSVLHLAAYYDFSGEPSPKYQEITVNGTRTLLRELWSLPVEQFIFSSTMLVHAPCLPGQKIHEESPLRPKWDYPQSKVEAEKMIHEHRGDLKAVILRIAGVYDDACHSIPLANQIQRIYERQFTSHVYPGNISRGQSFVHLDDLVTCFEKAVEKRQELSDEEIFLVGEPETLSYEELQKKIGFLLHKDIWQTGRIPKLVAKAGAWLQGKLPGDSPFIKPWMIDLSDDHFELDITKAKKVLGWKPEHSLRDTLPLMIERLKENPTKWHQENKLKISRRVGSVPEGSPTERARAA
jgi:nucleoside-diphosphate-sugar epimerase